MEIKLNHLANLSDGRYAAGMGVSWIGMACAPSSPYYCSLADRQEIAQWLHGPRFVAELQGFTQAEAAAWLKTEWNPDFFAAIEISNSNCLEILPVGCPYVLRTTLADHELPPKTRHPLPLYYVLCVPASLWPEAKSQVLSLAARFPVFLETSLGVEDLEGLVGSLRGIALDSVAEDRPGWQAYERLSEVLEWVAARCDQEREEG